MNLRSTYRSIGITSAIACHCLSDVSLLFDNLFLNMLHIFINLFLKLHLFFYFLFYGSYLRLIFLNSSLGLINSLLIFTISKNGFAIFTILVLESIDEFGLAGEHLIRLIFIRLLVILHNPNTPLQLNDFRINFRRHFISFLFSM